MPTPRNSIEFHSHTTREVHVELEREALLHLARDVDFVILRVQVFGSNGRPASRTLRLSKSLLEQPEPMPDWT